MLQSVRRTRSHRVSLCSFKGIGDISPTSKRKCVYTLAQLAKIALW